MTTREPVLPAAYSLGAFRACEHDHGILYRAVMESASPTAVDAALRAGHRAGVMHPSTVDCASHVGVLDLYADDGETTIGDLCIPTAEAWAWWVAAIELRATMSDCQVCEPAAYAATYAHLTH